MLERENDVEIFLLICAVIIVYLIVDSNACEKVRIDKAKRLNAIHEENIKKLFSYVKNAKVGQSIWFKYELSGNEPSTMFGSNRMFVKDGDLYKQFNTFCRDGIAARGTLGRGVSDYHSVVEVWIAKEGNKAVQRSRKKITRKIWTEITVDVL
jgi:ribosomal protein S13